MTRHSRTHFYKYVTAKVAKLTLTNCRVRYSAPNRFNDPFDTQFDLNLPFGVEELRQVMMHKLLEAVRSDEPIPNSNAHPAAWMIEQIRQNREKIDESNQEWKSELMAAIEEELEKFEQRISSMNGELRRNFWEKVKIFCVSEVHDNLLMWSHYSDNHKGAVIRFNCRPDLDTPLCIARPVKYETLMPVLAAIDEWVDFSFGVYQLNAEEIWNKMVEVKSNDWSYEKEWRVVLPDLRSDTNYKDLKIHPQEVGKIIFGCRMSDEDKQDILALLNFDFAHVKAIQAYKNPKKFGLDFEPIDVHGQNSN